VLYISGMEDRERLGEELASGRAHFLAKPFKTRDLTDKADEILSRSGATAVSR
jgi:response regulator RpfG family c-di-GMP phosphodiesterase